SGPGGIVTGARLESSLGAEVTLTLNFARSESFVLAQGANTGGMRIRLLRAHDDKARVLVTERGETASNYAVNLESRRQPFSQTDLDRATQRLKAQAFV